MAESSLSSNNPFRREPLGRAPPPTALPPSHTAEQFRSQLTALPASAVPPPTTSFQKPKVVKRVRVQSPPPSSPESAGAPESFPEWPVWPGDHDREALDGGQGHVFAEATSRDLSGRNGGFGGHADAGEVSPARDSVDPDVSLGPSARLGHVEEGNLQSRKAPALDVSAFSRLLLTGQRQEGSSDAGSSTTQAPCGMAGDSGSITDASSISRQSIFDMTYGNWETPRTSHEISDVGEDEQRELLESRLVEKKHSTLKKKPPPPSSRHGKLIPAELQDKDALDPLAHLACSDVNKPLPPAPGGPVLEDAHDSVFDREAAGKVPELDVDAEAAHVPPRPPTPPKPSRAASADEATPKKPPPPPKRGHGRASSKSLGTGSAGPGFTSPGDDGDLTPSRSSLESNRSRSSSLRVSTGAPAPPPPRRNHAAGRPAAAFMSSSVSSLTGMPSTGSEREACDDRTGGGTLEASDSGADGVKRNGSGTSLNAKPSPPPPRARTASLRSGRKPSVSSVDASPRRASRENDGAFAGKSLPLTTPPPPPPRQRGNSRGSIDGHAQFSRRASLESERIMEEADEDGNEAGADSAADSILAHLDALQREVDALRAQQERGG